MNNSIIYYRGIDFEKYELNSAQKYFNCTKLLTSIPQGTVVIARYSMFPFYFDQEQEILNLNCKLINNYQQHRYIADLKNWVFDLKDLTPKTWSELHKIPEKGPFVLKGETNSRKNDWKNSMFAENKSDAIRVHSELSKDSLIGYQNIYIREYVPLHTYMVGVNGMPVTKEFRFFVAFGKVLTGAFYWSNYVDELDSVPSVDDVPVNFLNKVISLVKDNVNFFVVDVAQTQSGEWIVIELNDGQNSGLSCNDPELLYSNLKQVINEKY